MRNYNSEIVTLNLTRLQVCDLLLACLAAHEVANDSGIKWLDLHDVVRNQLHKHDYIMNVIDDQRD